MPVRVIDLFVYNHESPRRPERFLPRKVTRGAAAIAAGQQETLELGDLGAARDWSHARDVARAAWLMVQQDEPDDYVIASGVGRTVGELVAAAFAAAGVSSEGRIVVDPAFVRPPEATPAIGDPTLARERLGFASRRGMGASSPDSCAARTRGATRFDRVGDPAHLCRHRSDKGAAAGRAVDSGRMCSVGVPRAGGERRRAGSPGRSHRRSCDAPAVGAQRFRPRAMRRRCVPAREESLRVSRRVVRVADVCRR